MIALFYTLQLQITYAIIKQRAPNLMHTPTKTQTGQHDQSILITGSSKQLKMQYIENKLQMKNKKIECLQGKVKQQEKHIERLQIHLDKAQKNNKQKEECVRRLMAKIDKLQTELAGLFAKVSHKDKQVRMKQVAEIKDKQANQQCQKINKVLTKQNNELIKQRHLLRQTINQLTETIRIKQKEVESEKQQVSLLGQLNQQLKIQVEELLFEVRMLNRRKQTTALQDYEINIDHRISSNNQQNNVLTSNKGSEQSNQIISLLKLRINSLEQQLQKSQKRCKHLQTIILSQ